MRLSTLLLAVAAAATFPATLPAVAQTRAMPATSATPAVPAAPIAEEARAALSQVQVRGQNARHRLDADESRKVRGTYALSNGWTMQVVPRSTRVFISINDGTPIELLAQSANKFASADGNIATVFNLGPWEEDVVMSYVPDSRLSDERVVVGTSALAAR